MTGSFRHNPTLGNLLIQSVQIVNKGIWIKDITINSSHNQHFSKSIETYFLHIDDDALERD